MHTLLFARLPYSLACFLLLSSPAVAGPIWMATAHEFPNAPSPQNFVWQLRTASDETVSWEFQLTGPSPGIQVRPLGNDTGEYPNAVTPAVGGLDWDAWVAAILNPAFNRSLMTFAGVTTEMQWPGVRVPMVVDRIQVLNVNWPYGTTNNPRAAAVFQGAAVDEPIIPEPSAFVLWLFALHFVMVRFRW